MLIVCPNCATAYQVESTSLGAGGRSVRCARCRTVWFAAPTADAPPDMAVDDSTAAVAATDRDGALARGAEGDDGRNRSNQGAVSVADTPSWPDEMLAGPAPDQPDAMAEAMAMVDSPSLIPAPDVAFAELESGFDGFAQEAPGEDIGSVVGHPARLQEQRRREMLARGLTAAIVVMLTIVTALVLWRTSVVAALPQTASFFKTIGLPVNLRGLTFEEVGSKTEMQGGATILVVTGSVVNTVRTPVEVARLRFAIRDEKQHEIFVWTALPTRAVLGPGETLPFRSRLASPPTAGRDVVVRFFNRRDAPVAAR